MCVCVTGDKILVIGGMALDTNPRDMFVEFDVAGNTWQKLPSMPTPRYATFAFLIGDKLYVVGKCATPISSSLSTSPGCLFIANLIFVYITRSKPFSFFVFFVHRVHITLSTSSNTN